MPFGTDNLNYGSGLGDDSFGSSGEGYSSLEEGDEGYGSTQGGSIYDEYMEDATISDTLDVSDYLYAYDPLKEQNLLADYMSGLTDLGDKTEAVRTKAISERKALSKSIRGGLSSGTMEDAASQQKDNASRAQSGLYRSQASSKRALGENIGSLRESYEGEMASGIEAYNTAVNDPDGATYGDMVMADGSAYPGSHQEYNYRKKYGLSTEESGKHGTSNSFHFIHGTKFDGKPRHDAGVEGGQTIFELANNDIWYYKDDGPFYDGHWRRKAL